MQVQDGLSEMMVLGRDEVEDARNNARECLQAMTGIDDVETRRSLWRAASRYAQLGREKMRAETGGEYPAPALSTVGGAGGLVYSVDR